MSEIFKLDEKDLGKRGVLDFIHNHDESHLYWSDDWSPSFYSRLAYEGMISITYPLEDGRSVLLPEMQRSYAVLDWKNLHMSRQVKKLLPQVESGVFKLSINSDFEQVLGKIMSYHNPCWLTDKYADILRTLNKRECPLACKAISVELYDFDGSLLAGELGYRIGSIYTSLSGFSERDKGPRGSGTLQLFLLARLLEEKGFAFWNLGHPNMEYKTRIGAENLRRPEFLERWKQYRDASPDSFIL
ncbi:MULTISPECIES: GNAT family N-acetyltransferase [unclassified Oceanispirochaeta]|uniref:GNAT family N-acetyltransferase n=1 Tax=unclassified Oceanispirochaeta TaxID=2635722 RepID=UPI000E096C01|nr:MULTISPECIES: GNAT family N-acetyltransferase [unclassified Oceanispirochaeta]MBF9015883.1 GNAT family N-acetyltransferase [Oceanispirochaeta sp. M2]NPD72346.1 GNAT family N-acetyltransferase [Oceanispirochaeta sp. M1]RDG32116.1 GNAT family N-acetyltransferase [Oceanispirochaeta sp. M1]